MKNFSALYEQAASRKGGEKIIEGMIPKPNSAAALVRIPDDRLLSGMAKAVFRAGFNWSVIVDLAAKHGTAAKYFANYLSADYVGLLSRENVFDGSPTSKSSLADIQSAFNEWVDDGGESLTRVSRCLLYTSDAADDASSV